MLRDSQDFWLTSRPKRLAYAIEKIPRKRKMIGWTSFHIRVSGILDISFLCARIPFQRLTCYSFCKNTLQPLPRTFLKNRRALVPYLAVHIRAQHNFRGISELHKRQKREDAFISSRSHEIRSFAKRGDLNMDPPNSNVENGFIMSLTRILSADIRVSVVIASKNLPTFFEVSQI